MKTCKFCGKEFDENLTFCPFCSKANSDRKLTYIEKKKARDKDTEIILSKASISDEEIKSAKDIDLSCVQCDNIGTINSKKTKSLAFVIGSVLVMIASIILAEVFLKGGLVPNLKLFIVVVAYFLVAVAGATCISNLYIFLSILKLQKQEHLVLKVYFNKGPLISHKLCLYEIKTTAKCEDCDGVLHPEVKDEDIVLVCSMNRAHLYKVDKDKLIERL